MLTTNQKGAIAEAKIAAAALELGVGVARPASDERYDLILDARPRLIRVQCKWAVRQGAVVHVRCRGCRRGRDGLVHRGYVEGEIDMIAAYCAAIDRCYLLPLHLSVGRAAVQLRLAPSQNNQRARIHWARDYELGATLSKFYGPIAQLGERQSGTLEVAGSIPAGSTNRVHAAQAGD
jgi:hypothetical protein